MSFFWLAFPAVLPGQVSVFEYSHAGFETVVFGEASFVYRPFADSEPPYTAQVWPYRERMDQGLSYIELRSELRNWSRILVLQSSNLLLLYDERNAPPWFWGTRLLVGNALEGFPWNQDWYTDVSSELSEGPIIYRVQNLSSFRSDECWAEAEPGDGVGAYFTMDLPAGVNGFWVSNGFVSFDRPHLYRANNRVSEIRIENTATGQSINARLDDTPDPQFISFEIEDSPTEVRVIVTGVYPGSRFDDTCLNFFLPYFGRPPQPDD